MFLTFIFRVHIISFRDTIQSLYFSEEYMKLYVGNLSYSTTEDTLREAFSNYGDVISVSITKDKFTGASKGFGFVEMGTDLQSERAIGGMNGKAVDDRRIRVSEAVDKPKRDGGARKFFKEDRSGFRSGERRERRDGDRPFRKRETERGERRERAFGKTFRSGERRFDSYRGERKSFESSAEEY